MEKNEDANKRKIAGKKSRNENMCRACQREEDGAKNDENNAGKFPWSFSYDFISSYISRSSSFFHLDDMLWRTRNPLQLERYYCDCEGNRDRETFFCVTRKT